MSSSDDLSVAAVPGPFVYVNTTNASGSSYGVGFDVGVVLGRAAISGQRVLLLYHADRRGVISRLIVGSCDESCATMEYTSMPELATITDRHFGPVSRAAAGNGERVFVPV